MDQRISFLTLAVRDLGASRRFYVDGLGWTPELEVEGDVLMIKTGDRLVLSLWDREHFQAEVGAIASGLAERDGVAPFTISHNVATEAEVDEILEVARAAGADPVHQAVQREWGGYTGYFGDPDGYRWEIATRACPANPGGAGRRPDHALAALPTLRRHPVCARAGALPPRAWTTPASTTIHGNALTPGRSASRCCPEVRLVSPAQFKPVSQGSTTNAVGTTSTAPASVRSSAACSRWGPRSPISRTRTSRLGSEPAAAKA